MRCPTVPTIPGIGGAAVGGVSFNPGSVAGLVVWLRPEGLSGFADNAPIDSWPNNGSLAAATQSVAGDKPLCKTGILNGYRVARFDGVTDYFNLPSLTALTAGTGFVVHKRVVDPPLAANQCGLWKFEAAAVNGSVLFTDGIFYDAFGTTVRKVTGDPTLSFSSLFRYYGAISAANDWRSYVDGTLQFSTGTNTVDFSSLVPTLGRSKDGGAEYFLEGDIAEFLLYDTALSTPNRQSVEAYLRAKYGLS